MTTDIESIVDGMSDDLASALGRWWEMRRIAIELGILAEKQLLEFGSLEQADRRFYNRTEWRRLTRTM